MKPAALSTLPLLVSLAAAPGWAAAPARSAPVTRLPAVTFGGKAVDLGAQKTWRVVTFWSADCPCVRDCERLSLVPLARHYQGRVSFYAVESGRLDLSGDRRALAENARLHRLPFPVLLDPDRVVADALHAVSTPQTFLLDPTGRVVFQGAPDDSWEVKARTGRAGLTHAYLADALAQALAGRPIARPYVPSFGCGIDR